jgi:phosphatidylglycerol:prolipoprotein diacylglycerol transferase
MYPILFNIGPVTIYSYGFLIAIGAVLGFTYLYFQSKKLYNLTFDQCNTLFIYLVIAGVAGGKLFMIFEDPSYYLSKPGKLVSGSGFVFYGSLIFAIPTMLWFFKKNNLPTWGMLDIMGPTACIAHGFGRIGCFLAGCCYGKPTDSIFGVTYVDAACQAEPLNTPLHPTQLYEAGYIFSIFILLSILKKKKQFDGQLFLVYLILYAIGRGVLELFRADLERGFVIKDLISNSQFISVLIISIALYFYFKLKRKAILVDK